MKENELNKIAEKLTKRQFEIFELVGKGKTSKEIANELCIAENTVKNHRNKIRKELDLEGYGALYHLSLKVRLQNQ
jgi:RNA polymerase sigma factor (sigma-70 family)